MGTFSDSFCGGAVIAETDGHGGEKKEKNLHVLLSVSLQGVPVTGNVFFFNHHDDLIV